MTSLASGGLPATYAAYASVACRSAASSCSLLDAALPAGMAGAVASAERGADERRMTSLASGGLPATYAAYASVACRSAASSCSLLDAALPAGMAGAVASAERGADERRMTSLASGR